MCILLIVYKSKIVYNVTVKYNVTYIERAIIMSRILALVLMATMLFCACCMSVSAGSADIPRWYGDVDFNGDINIADVTEIQRYIAGYIELSKLDIELADVNIDGEVSVFDATAIQRELAGDGILNSRIGDTFYNILYINNLASDYDDGVIEVGVPVTFTVHDYNYEGAYESYDKISPLRYEFYVNGEIVYDTLQPYYNNTFTYTFDEVGSYTVKAIAYNVYDSYDSFEYRYQVVDNDGEDSFTITGVSQNRHSFDEYNNSVLYAHAQNGAEPYEYRFVSKDLGIDQEYSQNNSIDLGRVPTGTYSMEIFVRDANNVEVSKTYTVKIDLPLNG